MSEIRSIIGGAVRSSIGAVLSCFDPPVVVLIYHRVANLVTDPQQLAVTPVKFQRQMEWIKANYRVLRFEEDWRSTRERGVVITFDDGYADNFTEALPILERCGVPATFFISTSTIGSDWEFWWDEIERCLLASPPEASWFDVAGLLSCPTRTPSERAVFYQTLHRVSKPLPVAERAEVLARLRLWAGVDHEARASHRALSKEELLGLAQSPLVTIGAHTVNHVPLAHLPPEMQRQEILASRQQLEDWIARPIDVFSYPFGSADDFNDESVRICRAARFRKAAANIQGAWHRWYDDMKIPRHLVRDWDLDTFQARIRSFFHR